MPTQHVEPSAGELLQDVGNALLKARKVVVVTGAGISTNSGIPDFRSENGLYSLIQAQFDAAARQSCREAPSTQSSGASDAESDADDRDDDPPPSKRQKLSRESPTEPVEIFNKVDEEVRDEIQVRTGPEVDSPDVKPETEAHSDTIVVAQPGPARVETQDAQDTITVRTKPANTSYLTPRPKRGIHVADPTTSPLSSPPPEDSIVPPSTFRTSAHRRVTEISVPLSSSPLSSPPAGLFDMFLPSSPSDTSFSGRRSSTSPSEVDDTPPSQNLFGSSQGSAPGRSTLPNMKGKDLFDASIWADPLRTSVFYTFATSLRQKIRDVRPTTSHHFISHLRDRGKLVRCYTQNIDQIEEKVGLSTTLTDGPGSRGRFSRRSTANANQLSKMAEQVSSQESDLPTPDKPSEAGAEADSSQQSQGTQSGDNSTPATEAVAKLKAQHSGVECVFLHGSLDLLRCFLCARVCAWDERETETLSGQQPECPHCVGATVAREEKGKRALGVGKLRPDIVLYGEEHPSSHLISPIVTHDLGMYPDMLLILGTSLRVHGLKVMVKEFAKAVHSKGGKVVFVNFTKPPESSWGDIIDYWIEWDCDAWVQDLQNRVPKLWQAPEPPKPKKKKESAEVSDEGNKQEVKRPPPVNPAAIRDTKVTGAYWTLKIMSDLHRITGTEPPPRRASISTLAPAAPPTTEMPLAAAVGPKQKAKRSRPRKSAPGALEQPKKPSTLNPNHGRSRSKAAPKSQSEAAHPRDAKNAIGSILNSVKANPRARKRKRIDGEEVVLPTVGKRRSAGQAPKAAASELTLAPLSPQAPNEPMPPFRKLEPMEPNSPPQGPLASISPNMRSAAQFGRKHAFYLHDPLVQRLESAPKYWNMSEALAGPGPPPGSQCAEANAMMALADLSQSPVAKTVHPPQRGFEGRLMHWGSNWSCRN